MIKKVICGFLVLFYLSFVVAHGGYYDDYVFKEKITETKYFLHKDKVITTTTYIDYDNENRYPTYDYRHGYSYRATKEYLNDRYEKKEYFKDYDRGYEKDYYDYDRDDWEYKKNYYDYDYGKDVYYKYVPHLRTYEKKWCRHEAPRGQLFYIKCPY